MDKEKTDVIFRMLRGECVAVMPGLAGTRDPYSCACYQHVGQHGVWGFPPARLAKPHEFGALLRELKAIGYNVQIVKRATAAHRRARLEQIK